MEEKKVARRGLDRLRQKTQPETQEEEEKNSRNPSPVKKNKKKRRHRVMGPNKVWGKKKLKKNSRRTHDPFKKKNGHVYENKIQQLPGVLSLGSEEETLRIKGKGGKWKTKKLSDEV